MEAPVADIPVGSGRAVRVRDLVETIHRLSGARTELRFGAVAYRPGEPMHSEADLRALGRLGWSPAVTLEEGIRLTLQEEQGER